MTIETIVVPVILVLCVLIIFSIRAFRPKSKKSTPTKAGRMIIDTTNPEKDVFSFELDISIAEMIDSDEISFKVCKDEK